MAEMTKILKEETELENELLISILENKGVLIQLWDLCFVINPPGKLVHWYASQLGIGTKRVLKLMRRFVEQGFAERRDFKRSWQDTFRIPKYDLTPLGKKKAVRLKQEKLAKQQCLLDPRNCLMRVLISNRSDGVSEDFLFAALKHRIGNLDSVKIKTEVIDEFEYLITRGDIVVVTLLSTDKERKVLLKTLKLSDDQLQIVKKYSYSCSAVRRYLKNRNKIDFIFEQQEPLTDGLRECDTVYKKEKVKIILKEWKNHLG